MQDMEVVKMRPRASFEQLQSNQSFPMIATRSPTLRTELKSWVDELPYIPPDDRKRRTRDYNDTKRSQSQPCSPKWAPVTVEAQCNPALLDSCQGLAATQHKKDPLVTQSDDRHVSSWNTLETAEKLECRGSRLTASRVGRYAWFAKGAVQRLYADKVETLITRIIDKNHRLIYKSSTSGLSWSLMILGSAEDISATEPTILLLTNDTKLGQRAKRAIEQTTKFQKYRSVYQIMVDPQRIDHPAKIVFPLVDESPQVVGITICGAAASIKKFPSHGNPHWSRVTCGGVLLIDGHLCALTVAHGFLGDMAKDSLAGSGDDCAGSSEPRSEGGSLSDIDKDWDNEFQDINSDDNFEDAHYSPAVIQTLEAPSGEWLLHLNTEASMNVEAITDTNKSSHTEPFSQPPLGRLTVTDAKDQAAMDQSLVSLDGDWALFPIEDSQVVPDNSFRIPGTGSISVRSVSKINQECHGKLWIAGGTTGVVETSFMNMTARYIFPWGHTAHTVLCINAALDKGDSGAWVFDDAGSLYGMAVATIPALSVTYILRAEDVFQDITHKAKLTTRLASLISQQSSAEPATLLDELETANIDDLRSSKDVIIHPSIESTDHHIAVCKSSEAKDIIASGANKDTSQDRDKNDNLYPPGFMISGEIKLHDTGEYDTQQDNYPAFVKLHDAEKLLEASKAGRRYEVRQLLEQGIDVNYKDFDGNTALMLASQAGDEDVVQILLAAGANANLKCRMSRTALSLASFMSRKKVVEMLLEAGADVNARDGSGDTALSNALSKGHEDIVRILLAAGADVNAQGDHIQTALRAASFSGHENIMRMLLEAGADVNAGSSLVDTALITASFWGHENIVKMLLAAGADINIRSRLGNSALNNASIGGFENIVKMLLAAGADVNTRDSLGNTALINSSITGHENIVEMILAAGAGTNTRGDRRQTALRAASQRGYENIAKMLLAAGADVNARDGSDDTPIISASYRGHETVVEMLLAAGADANARSRTDDTALIYASQRGYANIVEILLAASADANAQSETDGTALIHASIMGCENIVETLLAAGADVNTRSVTDGTALICASAGGYENIVEILLAAEARVDVQDRAGNAALIYASQRGYENIVEILLAAGADVDSRSGTDGTALIYASQRGYKNIVEILLAAGADVDSRSGTDGTALIYASQRGYENIVEILLAAGAQVDAQDNTRCTAIIYALQRGYKNISTMLLKAGTHLNARGSPPATAFHPSWRMRLHRRKQMLIEAGAVDHQKVLSDRGTVSTAEAGIMRKSTAHEKPWLVSTDDEEDVYAIAAE